MLRLFYTNEKVDNRIFQYFLGFQPSDGRLLFDDEKKEGVVFLDGRYFEKEMQAKNGKRNIEKVLVDRKFVDILGEHTLRQAQGDRGKVFLEKSVSYGVFHYLQQRSKETYDRDIFVFKEKSRQRETRLCKSVEEIDHIQHAIALTEDIWTWIEELALAGSLLGKTELEVRGMIVEKAFSLGLEGESFDTIVATGANSAIPHHQTGRDSIGVGPLLVDMGFRWEGWCSDFTRTIRVCAKDPSTSSGGQSKKEFEEVLRVVQEAHDVALAMVQPGITFKDIALAARKVIEDEGYGDYFTHALGHGVGLDVHEAPSVSVKSEDVITSGMVFTIEPGIYLPGKFGVRWENIVVAG